MKQERQLKMSATRNLLALVSLSLMALLAAPQAGAIYIKSVKDAKGLKDYQDYLHQLPDSGVFAERQDLQRQLSEKCGREPGLKVYSSEYSKFGRLSGSSLLAEREKLNAFDLMARLDPEKYGIADASNDCTETSRRMAAANMEYQARLLYPDSAVNSSSGSKVLPTEIASSSSPAGEGSSADSAH